MKRIRFFFLLILLTGYFCPFTSYAWDHSIEFGYGYSHDPNHSRYNNSGVMLSGDIFPIWRGPWTFFSINGSLGQWYTTTPVNKNLTSGALSLALRLYPVSENAYQYFPYFLAAFGPAIISHREFGENTQAKNITIQSNLGAGIEFNQFDINLRLQHFSNAGLSKPNQGFNILYLLSLGYLF